MDRLGAGAHLVLAGLSVALLWHSEGLKFTQMWTIMPLELERNPEFSLSFIRFNIQIYLWKTVKLSLSNYHKRDFFLSYCLLI